MSESWYRSELENQYPLDEIGSRFSHYSELREVFAEGIEILKNLRPEHKSASDVIKLAELKAAERLIAKRLEILSGYERKTAYSAPLPSTIRQIEVDRLRKKGDVNANSGSLTEDKASPSDIT